MNVRTLTLTHFTAHDSTVIQFPSCGIVLVTGENGSGKSSLPDAVAWAGWGKTLRGEVPWRGDAKDEVCTVQLATDKALIARTRSGKSNSLEWFDPEVPETALDPDYENNTKSQEALARIIGPFDLWRRSHVFSSSDAMHFSIASDGERKRLIESFLGNDRFDPALKKCRDDLKMAIAQLDAHTRDRDVKIATLTEKRKQLAQTQEMLDLVDADEDVVEPAPLKGKTLGEILVSLKRSETELLTAQTKLRGLDRTGGDWDAQVRLVKQNLDSLAGDLCPTCVQKIPASARASLKADLDSLQAKAQAEHAELEAKKDVLDQTVRDLVEEVQTFRRQREQREQAERQYKDAMAAFRKASNSRSQIQLRHDELTESTRKLVKKIAVLEDEIDEVTADVAELTEVEDVLGLKGVRAHILGRSLTGIEAIAQAKLARLHPALTIQLKPYSEKGPQDAISLTIGGRGRGSYKSNSAGERRRVDIAMLLGLGEVAAAAQGTPPGTIWFDEVFDCLDAAGTEAVAALLHDLAKDRCVVVITHSADLIERLPGVQRVHVAQGRTVALG